MNLLGILAHSTEGDPVLGLLPMSDRDKDAEILVLRHQIAVLERHLGGTKVRFTALDRAFLAGAAAPPATRGAAPNTASGTS